ncbi:MAG: sulfocyanin-like copper-binding protein [Gemmatimonadota bacterium]|nr:sulfocyanin-like copper-binding protein [Gemmatimonadota bacterium]
MRFFRLFPTLAVVSIAACGGGESADSGDAPSTDAEAAPEAAAPAMPSGPMTMPDWYAIDRDAETVNLTITAGSVPDNNYWNYNGAINGSMAITVPEGYTVTITLVNEDPNMPHSVVISDETEDFSAAPSPEPVFEGAATENPTSMVDATMPGETETITFVAESAGNYSMVCTIPGHTALGMWIFFNVVPADAEVGIQER